MSATSKHILKRALELEYAVEVESELEAPDITGEIETPEMEIEEIKISEQKEELGKTDSKVKIKSNRRRR